MSRQIKFTSLGVPYVLEFENVSFASERRRRSPSPSSSTSSFCYVDRPHTPLRRPSFSLRSPSSIFKRTHTSARHIIPPTTSDDALSEGQGRPRRVDGESTKSPPSDSHVPAANGICIHLPAECELLALNRKEKLVHLQQIISAAVLDAGMSRSPGNTNTENHGNGGRRFKTPNALFCGTYGQMMAALEGAGLSSTPCSGETEDLPGYTRLGALFVARNDGSSGVQLRKITLWG